MKHEFWDERYRSRSALWSGKPNAHLVSEALKLAPARALDVGCGEGADAIWLAGRGWRVTAVDFSSVALERGAARAAELGLALRIDWLERDLMEWPPPQTSYELASAQFMQLPADARASLFQRLSASVARGGSLLIVGHHPSDLETTVPRPPAPELYFTAEDVAASLDPRRWEIVVSAARERTTPDPQGRAVKIHDAVLHARRRI
ncbi:MAG: class I SAM-dependent methyltransferase [Candidatus Eremiobacteraeota bacterium]|nr:class I SAM-dependent methyltransferase [Candidatus Eremiobacteraeota bacterium]MBC5826346.1 class I SAM-dependent methyltransferase [Candidatus Eremiobacteraeota bacterium]